ncbi:MAG: Unknown protein [uncultured Thiotrichaceae bacterium]|uniref:DUF3149 domain-containing protein n=1 Tax=uncultured Thiotrichaceae bacterium TaxID=298394 RepID=A0A6S6SI63_9GAMM|nr:MAG: Unknown protein [uncultured Thiotrichaceae bacterium]
MNFFSSFEGILLMTVMTIVAIVGFMGYMFWKVAKLSNHKPKPGEKPW